MNNLTIKSISQNGFTLIEMAIVLLIIGLLIGGLIPSFSAQLENKRYSDTVSTINMIEQALMGYAVSNGGQLPTADTDGDGDFNPAALQGTIPWRTLGLDRNSSVDAWNNPYLYHVDNGYITKPALPPNTQTNLSVSTLITPTALTSANPGAPIVIIVSFGKDGIPNGNAPGVNNGANTNYTQEGFTEGIFDDEVHWLSKNILLNKLVDAGVWP